jgi:hypothetical protein
VTINLRIELLKVFTIEFSLSSDKEIKLKKGQQDEEDDTSTSDTDKPASASG